MVDYRSKIPPSVPAAKRGSESACQAKATGIGKGELRYFPTINAVRRPIICCTSYCQTVILFNEYGIEHFHYIVSRRFLSTSQASPDQAARTPFCPRRCLRPRCTRVWQSLAPRGCQAPRHDAAAGICRVQGTFTVVLHEDHITNVGTPLLVVCHCVSLRA